MTFRAFAVFVVLAYGAIIPIAASDFFLHNPVATFAMVAVCMILAALLWSRRAVLLNILITFYLLRVYLTRPYVDVFLARLNEDELAYVSGNNSFFNSADAVVVYLSLLSLIFAWYLGLIAARPTAVGRHQNVLNLANLWIFQWIDRIVMEIDWRFWLVWICLTLLNYQSASATWQGVATGHGNGLFAYGLFSTVTVNYVCLYAFVQSRPLNQRPPSKMLLVPVVVAAMASVMGGSRSFIFTTVILFVTYWLFLNYRRCIAYRDTLPMILLASISPFVILGGLLAQSLRPLLMYGAEPSAVESKLREGLDLLNPDNPLYLHVYFGITELLHRLSSLQAQFLILNDHFIHIPSETYNPIESAMRIVNDLVPGDVFDNVLSINRLYNYIYHDQLITNSENWSIQGTLYLYFGFWISPVIVFLVAYGVGRYCVWLDRMAKASPAFAIFFVLFANDLLENGTLERVIPIDIVRPLASFFGFIVLVGLLHVLFPPGRLRTDFSLNSLKSAAMDIAKRWRGSH